MFHAIEYKPPAEIVDDEFPFWLSTGRVFAHYHTGTMTRNCPTLNSEISEGFLEINPLDADHIGICQGDEVKIASRRGQITAKTMVTERVKQGLLFMPFHFIESNVNLLTNPAHDPIAKIPEFKVCAVRLEKAG